MIKRCNMMIFGSTGDLTYQKLIPAIFDLYRNGELCSEFQLVCVGRKPMSLDEYLEAVDKKYTKEIEFLAFKTHIHYHEMDFTDTGVYDTLKQFSYDKSWIYYLATAPRFFEVISGALNQSGLMVEDSGFRRIVFEKPFGENFLDAKHINKNILKIMKEDQIYRIDHYLGKEMIQNILLTRVYNTFFEMLWHKDAIECFEIVVSESQGVKNRGSYYDRSGALKDMVQNHMFQIVGLLAMDLPDVLIPDTIRQEKTKILKKIHVTDEVVLGQYNGYLDEKDIPVDSETETFVALKLFVDHKRWRGVPFYLKTGKALKEKKAHIVVHFKKNQGNVKDNLLVIQVQPDEGIYLQLNSKKPGISNEMTQVTMDYCHSCLRYGSEPSAYGRLILDVMLGDKSLFASWEEIESSWSAVEKIPQFITVSVEPVYETDIHMNLHVGTHVDYPLHMIPGGKTSDDYDLSHYIGKCYVLDATYLNHRVLKRDLQAINLKGYEFILFKTKNSLSDVFNPDYIFVSEEAAAYLATFELKGVGIDALGIEREQPGHPTHKLLLGHDILIYEGLDLKDVKEGVYEFIGLPTKIKGVEAAPVRAMLR